MGITNTRPQDDNADHVLFSSSSGSRSASFEPGPSSPGREVKKTLSGPFAGTEPTNFENRASSSLEGGPSWSIGAELHSVGQCRPCAYHRSGCFSGAACIYCHLCDGVALKASMLSK